MAKGKQVSLGRNVAATVEGKTLTITVDLSADHGRTPKGFRRVASTGGNQPIPTDGDVRVGLNVYDRAVE